LHANGYKIGERTITGAMDNLELACLFTGYGYQVRIVEYGALAEGGSDDEHNININYDMAASMEWALEEIKKIQSAARSGKPITKPRWPMIVMRTPKGWSGPVHSAGNAIEGSWRAHQVPLPAAATDEGEFGLLTKWLESYNPKHLFNTDVKNSSTQAHAMGATADGVIDNKALRIIPKDQKRRMGMVDETYRGFIPLETPNWKDFSHPADKSVSNMKA
jgi:xylulose-5-phosphate/fructose-6-phosphate phosphoketolase